MASVNLSRVKVDDPEAVKREWLGQLAQLVETVNSWSTELDWSTRQISKKMKDSILGSYEAPALLMQRETFRVLLDPIARFLPGADGVVDLYLMPAYDDIASLYLVDGEWRLHVEQPQVKTLVKSLDSVTLTKAILGQVLDDMIDHAS